MCLFAFIEINQTCTNAYLFFWICCSVLERTLSANVVFNMFIKDSTVVSILEHIFSFGLSNTECSWAVTSSIGQSDTLALSDEMEVVVANVHAVDREACAVLPSVTHLKVAEPGLAVQGALFVMVVKWFNFIPTGVVLGFSLNTLIRQIVEV